MPKPYAIGIDLGTTYSAMARIDETGRSAMVRNHEGELLTPSVVYFDDREILVGKDAKKAAGLEPDRVAECAKRDMGRPNFSHPIRGAMIPPEVIQSCVLRKLHKDLGEQLGPDLRVVITVPAYFDESRRKATADAAEMAGLEILDIVNEPTAAALAFGEQLGYLDSQGTPREQQRILVYDLGGGTFDVTLIDIKPGEVRTVATDGDVRLGGFDWDSRLADYLADEFHKAHREDPRSKRSSHVKLLRAAEQAKHTLSARDQAPVRVEHNGQTCELTVTRAKFEELTEDLLERTAHTVRELLQGANTTWSNVSRVLLTGGSTRMPMVGAMLERLSGIKPDRSVHPDEAVARGAAIYARYTLDSGAQSDRGPAFQVVNVNSHSLGIVGVDQETGRRENIILIPRNTPLPCSVKKEFVTKKDDQHSVVVQVLEGESKAPENCTLVAKAVLRQMPVGLPKGWPIEVTYEYATNGRLAVHAVVPGTKGELLLELERERGLTSERVARWRRVVTATEASSDSFDALIDEVLGDGEGGETSEPAIVRPRPAAASVEAPPAPTAPSAAPAAAAAPLPAMPAAVQNVAAPARPGAAPRRSPLLSALYYVCGYVLSAAAGLALGYYILCLLKPEANFLHLSLPGVAKVASGSP